MYAKQLKNTCLDFYIKLWEVINSIPDNLTQKSQVKWQVWVAVFPYMNKQTWNTHWLISLQNLNRT
jgi:hypothetical protein